MLLDNEFLRTRFSPKKPKKLRRSKTPSMLMKPEKYFLQVLDKIPKHMKMLDSMYHMK